MPSDGMGIDQRCFGREISVRKYLLFRQSLILIGKVEKHRVKRCSLNKNRKKLRFLSSLLLLRDRLLLHADMKKERTSPDLISHRPDPWSSFREWVLIRCENP